MTNHILYTPSVPDDPPTPEREPAWAGRSRLSDETESVVGVAQDWEPPLVKTLDYGAGNGAMAKWFQQQMENDVNFHSPRLGDPFNQVPMDFMRGVLPYNALVMPSRTHPRKRRPASCSSPSSPESSSSRHRPKRYSLGGDFCSRTARKIEFLLSEALDNDLIKRVAFVSALMHSWRTQVVLRKQGEFVFNDVKYECERKAAEQRCLQEQHQSRVLDLCLCEWSVGEHRSLLQRVVNLWTQLMDNARESRRQEEKIGIMGGILSHFSGMHTKTVFYRWRDCLSQLRCVRSCKAFVDQVSLRWTARSVEVQLRAALFAWRTHGWSTCSLRVLAWQTRQGMLACVMSAWQHVMKLVTLAASKRTMGQSLVRRADGDNLCLLKYCVCCWQAQVASLHAVLQERKIFEEFLEDDGKNREEERRSQRELEFSRRERHVLQVELMMKQWIAGQDVGLLSECLEAWSSRLVHMRAAGQTARNRQAVHAAMFYGTEWSGKALQQICFLNWHTFVGYARQHSKVEGVTDAILQKWFRGDAVGLVATVFREWLHARRVSKVVHSQRQMGTRMHLVQEQHVRHLCFLMWSRHTGETKQRELDIKGVRDSVSKMFLDKEAQQEEEAWFACCFRGWFKAARDFRIERYQDQEQEHKEQLWLAYQQIEDVNDSLQKELHLKKDLASKLDVAYSKLRGQQQSCSPGILSRYRTIRSPATRKPSDSPRTSSWPTPLRFDDVMPPRSAALSMEDLRSHRHVSESRRNYSREMRPDRINQWQSHIPLPQHSQVSLHSQQSVPPSAELEEFDNSQCDPLGQSCTWEATVDRLADDGHFGHLRPTDVSL